MKATALIAAAAAIVTLPAVASAQLFADDFLDPTGTGYTVNAQTPGRDTATFAFDYSTVGIPAAPGSVGTTGLKLQANSPSGGGVATFSGISVSPILGSLLTDNPTGYTMSFYTWQNAPGPFPAGGTGSTQLTNYGVGTDGTTPQWQGSSTLDSALFGVSGDGGTTSDWRAYVPGAGGAVIPTTTSVYDPSVTSLNGNVDPFWAQFTGSEPPAAQALIDPLQFGQPQDGAPAFEWKLIEIAVTPGQATWSMDGVLIATINNANLGVFGTTPDLDGTVFFGQSDINTGATDSFGDPFLFGLIDNVVITSNVVIPEPASLGLLSVAGLGLLRRRKA